MNIQIETERIILKKYSKNDIDNIIKIKSDSLVWRFSDKKVTNDIGECKKHLDDVLKNYAQNISDFHALFIKDTKEYIGEAGILSFNQKHNRGVIGYNLLSKYWNNGYATEITKGLVENLFNEYRIERLEALVCDSNESSKKVLEKSGFILEGLLRNFAYINNNYADVCYYGILKHDYFENSQRKSSTVSWKD